VTIEVSVKKSDEDISHRHSAPFRNSRNTEILGSRTTSTFSSSSTTCSSEPEDTPSLTPIYRIGTRTSETDNSEYVFSLSGQLVGNGFQPRDFRSLTKVDTKNATTVVPLSLQRSWHSFCTLS
jgi:hypothetical protein